MATTPITVNPSDFSNRASYGNASPFGSPYVLMGDRYEQAPTLTSIYYIDDQNVPSTFPMQQWFDQSSRYITYWAWFNGDILAQARTSPDGELEFRFPLRINVLRDIVRKHSTLLWGQVEDGPDPLVTAHVEPRKKLTGKPPSDDAHALAELCENIINQVWTQSDGRSIQQEAGEMSQFLGGHAFQISYDAWRDDVDIPIFIRSWKADLFLPVWKNNNYWDLEEVYVVCRLESAVAKNDYGVQTSGAFAYYVEHWTRQKYSIYVDGKPISRVVNGETITFADRPNPFGFVPFVYIPHLREGAFFGSSHVPDLVGLTEEYNSAMANLGDAIQDSIHRERYVRNAAKRSSITLPNGLKAVDLGTENPSAKNPPETYVIDSPSLSQGLVNYPTEVYKQIRRTAFLPPVAEGEDEGSQRSGATLDIRFWPAIAHAKVERGYWETGLNKIAQMIISICDSQNLFAEVTDSKINRKDLRSMAYSQNWSPQLPRDREAEVTEYLNRLNQGGISLTKFLENIGDVDNIEEEEERIREFQKYMANLVEKPIEQTINKVG